MAQIEAKLLLAMLCQHYTFDLVEGEKEKISYSMSITMRCVVLRRTLSTTFHRCFGMELRLLTW